MLSNIESKGSHKRAEQQAKACCVVRVNLRLARARFVLDLSRLSDGGELAKPASWNRTDTQGGRERRCYWRVHQAVCVGLSVKMHARLCPKTKGKKCGEGSKRERSAGAICLPIERRAWMGGRNLERLQRAYTQLRISLDQACRASFVSKRKAGLVFPRMGTER